MDNIDQHYIGGKWVDVIDRSGHHDIINPATEDCIGRLQFGGEADVDLAVDAAAEAFPAYARSSLASRVELLRAIANEYALRADELADAVSTEMGAPLERLARRAHVPLGLKHLRAAAELAGQFPWESRQGRSLTLREPVGVCALITPWNWPLNQIACKVAPALLAGCTMVLKASEYAPLSATIFAEILGKAGVPAGVFNMVWVSGPEYGPRLASHPKVDLVSLTGSTAAGASVARHAAAGIKRVSLELGGKSANIILDDAPFEQAVERGVLQLMSNTGQSCNAPSRMLVPQARLAQAEEIAAVAAGSLRLGDPRDPATTTGPLANARQYERVQAHIRSGMHDARLVAGGLGRPDGLERGYFVRPTVFSAQDNTARIARDEVFGPVLTLLPYRDEAEAVAIANDSEYGLSAYVYGGSEERAAALARQLRVGQVHLNGAGADMQAAFGGMKQSGIGREWGAAGIDEFTELKVLMAPA